MTLRQFLIMFVLPSFCMTLSHACPAFIMPVSLRRLVIQFQQDQLSQCLKSSRSFAIQDLADLRVT